VLKLNFPRLDVRRPELVELLRAAILLPMMCCRASVAYIAFVDALRSDAANVESIHSAAKYAEGDFAVPGWQVGTQPFPNHGGFGPCLLGSAAVDRVSPAPPVLVCVADVDLPTAVAALHGIRAFAVAPSSCGAHSRPRSPARLTQCPWTMIINRMTRHLRLVQRPTKPISTTGSSRSVDIHR
jgi:hypothetical protein